MPSSAAEPTVAQVMLQMLADYGVEHVFGLPGVHNLAFWNCDDGPRIIGVRHEQAAGYAADGLARTTGRLGVALTTTGPGAMNVLAAFGEAAVSHSNIIVIASDVSTALRRQVPRGILHEMRDQAAAFAPLASRDDDGQPLVTNCTDGDDAIRALAAALVHHARFGEVAAYVGVPTDVLSAAGTPPVARPDSLPQHHDTTAIVEALAVATRPVLWLGGGVTSWVTRHSEAPVRALAERLGSPVLTSFAGRGLLAGHPLLIDGPVHEPEARALLAEADCLVVLGSDFDGMNTRNWRIPLPANVVTINHAAEPIRTNLPDAVHCTAPLDVLPQVVDAIEPRTPWRDAIEVSQHMRQRLHEEIKARDAMTLVESVEAAWPAEAALVVDMCVAGYWLSGYARQPRPRRLAYPVGWGTLGFALPAAIGPASAGIPTLAVCGDGGAMFAIGELATYVQESLPITLLINDDGGYGMLRFDQQVFGHPERGVDLVTPDWLALAESFGLNAVEVPDYGDEFRAALLWAHARNALGHPVVILTRSTLVPPRTTSPRWNETP
jgi:acetolactate synthase-1/2/3 large subunit